MHEVNLVGITQPTNSLGDGTPEGAIVYMARVSNPDNQNNPDGCDKLIGYLIKNNHWSPFEMISLVVEIKTTRDISRQILRHRSFSFQEFSQRYAVVNSFANREVRLQDTKNRQNSIELSGNTLKEQTLRLMKRNITATIFVNLMIIIEQQTNIISFLLIKM